MSPQRMAKVDDMIRRVMLLIGIVGAVAIVVTLLVGFANEYVSCKRVQSIRSTSARRSAISVDFYNTLADNVQARAQREGAAAAEATGPQRRFLEAQALADGVASSGYRDYAVRLQATTLKTISSCARFPPPT